MHGDIAQNQREVTLKRFKEGKFNVLVATDVASRGLDIPNVDLVIQVEPPKDVETYIHRSGRTARAGRDGTCITFYCKKHMPLITNIEQRAGIKFQKIGIPQPEDVIKASSRDIIKNLEEVNQDITPLFLEAAESLIKKYGDPITALSTTLAYMSGHYKTALLARSLLTGQENCITIEIKFEQKFMAVSYVWGVLRKFLTEDIHSQIRGMRMFKDQTGAVFDVQEDQITRFEDVFNHLKEQRRINFEIGRAKTLPELREDDSGPMGRSFGGAGPSYGGGFNASGYGGGGYGGNRGGYGSQGGYGQQRGGYGGGQGGYGGNQGGYGGGNQGGSYGAPRQGGPAGGPNSDDRTVFVGNLGFNAKEGEISDVFRRGGLNPTRVRML